MPDDQNEDAAVDQIDPAEFAALKAELAGTKLDNACLAAGIDLATPTGKMFRKAWDGDPDPEKIRLAAAEIPGALKTVEVAPEPDPEIEREPGEATQLAERQGLTTGDAAGQADPNPKDEAFRKVGDAIDRGDRVEDAMGLALSDLVTAAMAGDKRVLVER